MSTANLTDKTLQEILSKLQEVHDLLSRHLKKPSSADKIFEPLIRAPSLAKIAEDAARDLTPIP